MDRINGSFVATDLHGVGKDGFKDGNKALGIPATIVNAEFLNSLQEEVANVIEPKLPLDVNNKTQLLTAINMMIAEAVNGGDYKDSVRVASTAAINLAAPGANIDGVAMVAGDRFLEKDNATLASRGIYIWNGAAVPATRALDADTGAELNGGAIIPVEQGTVNADTTWQLTTDGVVTIGTTGLTFELLDKFGGTAPLFDQTTKLATTAFVNRALGGLSGFTSVSASATLTLAQLGTHVQIAQATPTGQIFTLPPLVGFTVAITGYWITNDSPFPATIKANAAENINPLGNSFILQPRETVFVFNQGTTQWNLFGAIAALVFQLSSGASGWLQFPNGKILQWINYTNPTSNTYITLTLPRNFPTTIDSIVAMGAGFNQYALVSKNGGSLTTVLATSNQSGGGGTAWILGN